MDMWPVRLAKGIANAATRGVTLPGDVYSGKTPMTGLDGELNPEVIERSADLAMLVQPTNPAVRIGDRGIVGAARKGNALPQPSIADTLGEEFAARFGEGAIKKGTAAEEFGIPLTTGEAAKDFNKIQFEQTALAGGYGEKAQKTAQEFFNLRKQAMDDAVQQYGTNLDRLGQNVVSDPIAAGELTSESLKQAARIDKQGYKNLYDEFADLPGVIHAGAFEGIGQKIKGALSLGDNPVIIDDVTTPIASRALRDIENNIDRLKVQNRADPFGQPNPENIVGINLKGVDQTRKRLVQFANDARNNPSDNRAVGAIIKSFDANVEDAIANGLFSGSDRALEALKQARAGFSQYQKTFTSQKNDGGVGAVLEKIVGRSDEAGATAGEVANYLFGASGTGSTGLSTRLAARLKNILGEDSPEWVGIRQGMFKRLTESTEGRADWGPQKISERIAEFVNGQGRPLAHTLFTPPERAQMIRLANALKETIPPKGTVNTSYTAPVMARIVGNTLDTLISSLGFMKGGLPGLAAGWLTRVTRKNLEGRMQEGKVRQSIYGNQPRPQRQPLNFPYPPSLPFLEGGNPRRD